jgi:hypothetical protein
MAKNDFRFVDEIAHDYHNSQTSQRMLSECIKLVTDRQKFSSELTEI